MLSIFYLIIDFDFIHQKLKSGDENGAMEVDGEEGSIENGNDDDDEDDDDDDEDDDDEMDSDD